MIILRNLPIKWKLMMIIMITSIIVLLINGTAFIINDLLSYMNSTIKELSTLSRVVADNSAAALVLNDPETAVNILNSLNSNPKIIHSSLFLPDGRLFAEFTNQKVNLDDAACNCNDCIGKLKADSHESEHYDVYDDSIHFTRAVYLEDNIVGYMFICTDKIDFANKIRDSISIVLFVLFASLLIAFILSSKLQRLISVPILHLASITKTISGNKDYSIRAEKQYDDEIGLLIDGFNEMLMQIQNRDKELNTVIQGHRHTANALMKSEATLRSLFQAAPIGIGMIKDGTVAWVNERVAAMTGCTSEEIEGQSSGIFYQSADEFERVSYAINANLKRKKPQPVETRWCAKNGILRDVVINSTPIDPDDHSAGIVFTAMDITERKRAEAERSLLATAIEQAAESIFITDREGNIQYVNPAFEEMTGYTREEAIGQNPRLLSSGKHNKDFYIHMWKTIEGGNIWQSRITNKRKDGKTLEVELSISPVRDSNGTIVNYVSISNDVTRESELEVQLRQAQKMEAIGTLAGGIAHDFNNILSAVIGYTELAMGEADENGTQYKRLQEVAKAGERATQLVRQILTFSRQTEQERKPIQLQQIIKETIKLLMGSIPKTIEIVQDIDNDCGPVLADPTRIHQAVMNLCTNAYQAMRDHGGTLSIRLRKIVLTREEAALHLELEPGEFACLSVGDTGLGMSEDVRKRIFDPYFTTKKSSGGTGLGLTTVHGIVKSHDGAITVESRIGEGTIFNIFIPLYEGEVSYTKLEKTDLELPKGDERILFVDDEEAIVQLGKLALEKLGYHVTAKTNSIEAFETFKENQFMFDVVITDFTMPYMTGDTLSRKILNIRPEIPIILCTGFSESINEHKARNIGIKGYIMKPLVINELARTMRKILDSGKSFH